MILLLSQITFLVGLFMGGLFLLKVFAEAVLPKFFKTPTKKVCPRHSKLRRELALVVHDGSCNWCKREKELTNSKKR